MDMFTRPDQDECSLAARMHVRPGRSLLDVIRDAFAGIVANYVLAAPARPGHLDNLAVLGLPENSSRAPTTATARSPAATFLGNDRGGFQDPRSGSYLYPGHILFPLFLSSCTTDAVVAV